jgi:hypothetical protein
MLPLMENKYLKMKSSMPDINSQNLKIFKRNSPSVMNILGTPVPSDVISLQLCAPLVVAI